MAAEYPIFDRAGALEQVDNDIALFFELFDMFFEDYPAQRSQLESDIEQRNGEKLEFHAHAMKSALGSIGAMAAYQQASALERMGKANELAQATDTLASMTQAVEEYRVAATALRA